MAHQRKLIRQAIMASLKAANTKAGSRIFGNRSRQILEDEIPCILVYTSNEPVELFNEAPAEYKRKMNVSIELIAKANSEDDLDDVLDDFCEQVEAAIFSDDNFYGPIASLVELGETVIEVLSEGKNPVGGAKITTTFTYYQNLPGDLSGRLNDFETADVKIQHDGTILADATHDSLELPD